MHLSKLEDLEPFTTLDGSTIREIAGPAWTPARNQSLAEATVPVGGRTVAHYHRVTEELYFFTAGRGRMTLGDEEREVARGRLRRHPARGRSTAWSTPATSRSSCCAAARRRTRTRTPSW